MENRMNGVILKGIGGFYYVLAEGTVYETRARGRFRKDGITPMPGDRVEITPPTDTIGGYIEEIHERKNSLPRPMVANVGQLVIVCAAKAPAPDLLLVDKLILYARFCGVRAVLLINKTDQNAELAQKTAEEYRAADVDVLMTSVQDGTGLDAVRELLRGENTCFSGQSAVGKSSLLNAICPQLELKTGGLSKKTARGRHTTRHSELLYIEELDAAVIDTPGFSILEVMDIEPEELKDYYPEFHDTECRFGGRCLHHREPDCGVKARLAAGEIPKGRYERYLTLLQELKERKENKYD